MILHEIFDSIIMLSQQQQITQIAWTIDENGENNLWNDFYLGKEIQHTQIVSNYSFNIKCKSNLTDIQNCQTKISLFIQSLSQQIGCIKIDCSLKCNEINYYKRCPIVTIKANQRIFIENNYPKQIDIIIPFEKFKQFKGLKSFKSFKFEYTIIILTAYDLYGLQFSVGNKPISIKKTTKNNKLVYGYLNMLNDFNINKIKLTPIVIYDLIYKFYLKILYFNNSTNKTTLLWKFNNYNDISLFLNSKQDDTMTSKQFELNGCIFDFELTANGWRYFPPKGIVAIWLAVHKLPKTIKSVNVTFQVICTKVGYKCSGTSEVTEPQRESDINPDI